MILKVFVHGLRALALPAFSFLHWMKIYRFKKNSRSDKTYADDELKGIVNECGLEITRTLHTFAGTIGLRVKSCL